MCEVLSNVYICLYRLISCKFLFYFLLILVNKPAPSFAKYIISQWVVIKSNFTIQKLKLVFINNYTRLWKLNAEMIFLNWFSYYKLNINGDNSGYNLDSTQCLCEMYGDSCADIEFTDEVVSDPYCDMDHPTAITFNEISAAAYKIRGGLEKTPCSVIFLITLVLVYSIILAVFPPFFSFLK